MGNCSIGQLLTNPQVGWTASLILVIISTVPFASANDPVGTSAKRTIDEVTIEVGNLAAGRHAGNKELEWILGEIRSFKEAHPRIHVKTTAIGTPHRFATSLTQLPRLAENVIGIDSPEGYETSYLVSREYLVPMEEFQPDADLNISAYSSGLLEPVTYQGKVWGIPWVADALVLLCNWSVFEEAGITKPPTTWPEFEEVARKLTQDRDGDGTTDQWGFLLKRRREFGSDIWASIVFQKDGALMKDGVFALDNSICRESLEYVRTLFTAPYTSLEQIRLHEEVLGKRFAMQILDNVELADITIPSGLRIVPLPTFAESVTITRRSLYLAVRRSTPEKEAASWEFIKWICRRDSSPPLALGAGYPALPTYARRSDFGRIASSSIRDISVAYSVLNNIRDYGEQVEGRRLAFQAIDREVAPYLSGDKQESADTVLYRAMRKANELLKPSILEQDNRKFLCTP